MSRLTKKCEIKMPTGDYEPLSTTREELNKLGQLEDIEEELGIDLITLFKALKNGVWTKLAYKMEFNPYDYLSVHKDYIYSEYLPLELRFKDYGKNWALTREELE